MAHALGSTSTSLWYLSRGTGTVSLALFSLSMALGVLARGARPLVRIPRFAVSAIHRNVALLALGFLAVHVVSAIIDPFVTIGWLATLIPGASPYRSLAIGLGAVSLDLALAVVLTSLLRERIGRRTWRAVHWLAYACWPVAVGHTLLLGPDATTGAVRWFTYGSIALVAAATAWRILAIAPHGAFTARRRAQRRQLRTIRGVG